MGVQGFPTLKIVRPGKKPGRPTVEDYQGQRVAKAIIDAVKEKIPNHVKRVTDKGLEEWLKEGNDTAKAVLFSDKGATSATLRALAIDFAGNINIAQIRNKEKAAMELFGVESVPKLILLPGGDKEAIVYDGEMKKESMSEFLSQIAPPNPDCPLEKEKPSKKSSKDSPAFSKTSASHESADSASAKASATSITLEDPAQPTESPDLNAVTDDTLPPVIIPETEVPATIPIIETAEAIQKDCLSPKSKTCILALLPPTTDGALPEAAVSALASLGAIHKKHDERKSHLFPFYGVPASNPLTATLRSTLSLKDDAELELIATNAKRAWWKQYQGAGYGNVAVEDWVDAIRMGDGKKEKLPDSLIVEVAEEVKPKVEEQEPLQVEIEEIPDDFEFPATHHEHGEL